MNITGKVALVTGGARRVGRSIALALAKRGADVAVHYLTSAREAQAVVRECEVYGVKAIAVKADVSKSSEIGRFVKTIEKKLGSVDILVNSASIFERTPWATLSEKDWDRHLNTNLKGPFLLSQAVSARMIRRREGKIINILDGVTTRPYPSYLPYSVSKAGLECLTKTLALILAPHVQVNGVSPGAVLLPEKTTPSQKHAYLKKIPLGRVGSPEDIAQAVLFLVEGTDYATGTVLTIDGGRAAQ